MYEYICVYVHIYICIVRSNFHRIHIVSIHIYEYIYMSIYETIH